jgi:hypothetical protein
MACSGREIREHLIFMELLKLCPDLEERLLNSSEEEVEILAELVSSSLSFYTLWYPSV